jgi:hypothetical protein
MLMPECGPPFVRTLRDATLFPMARGARRLPEALPATVTPGMVTLAETFHFLRFPFGLPGALARLALPFPLAFGCCFRGMVR